MNSDAGFLMQAAFGIRSVFFITGAMLLLVGIAANRLVQEPSRQRSQGAGLQLQEVSASDTGETVEARS